MQVDAERQARGPMWLASLAAPRLCVWVLQRRQLRSELATVSTGRQAVRDLPGGEEGTPAADAQETQVWPMKRLKQRTLLDLRRVTMWYCAQTQLKRTSSTVPAQLNCPGPSWYSSSTTRCWREVEDRWLQLAAS